MEDENINLNYIEAKAKVYSRVYTTKKGVTESVQKSIPLAKDEDVYNDEHLIIIKKENFNLINNDEIISPDEIGKLKDEIENLKQQLQDKDNIIKDLQHEYLNYQNNHKNKIDFLNDELLKEKDVSKNAINQRALAENKLSNIQGKQENIKSLFNVILKNSNTAIEIAINETKKETYNLISDEVAGLSFWQRVKKVEVEDPQVNIKNIESKCFEIINNSADEIKKLE